MTTQLSPLRQRRMVDTLRQKSFIRLSTLSIRERPKIEYSWGQRFPIQGREMRQRNRGTEDPIRGRLLPFSGWLRLSELELSVELKPTGRLRSDGRPEVW